MLNPALLDEAAFWAARLMSGEASRDDYAAYSAWCALSPAHAAAGREVLGLWKLAGVALCARDEDWTFRVPQPGYTSHFNFMH